MPFLKLDLDDDDIGKFIQRETENGRVLTKPHYVESVVDSDAVTHCGRRMRRGTGFPFREVTPTRDEACAYCAEMIAEDERYRDEPAAEDDGSTVNETVP